MAWREPTEEDLSATLSVRELQSYRESAGLGGSDPVEVLISRTTAMVRGYARANRSVALSPNERELPEALISPAMDYAAYDVLKRMPVNVNEDRRRARDAAIELFKSVASGSVAVEGYGVADGSKVSAMPSMARPNPERLLD